MSKIAHYLQEHLTGEVVTALDARRHFSNDASIFSVSPAMVIYPRNESDIRKTARFSWQLAERGRLVPITARGSGTDQSGAAIGSGVLIVFPAHLNRIIEFDGKTGLVTAEPGINYGKLQQTLQTHGRYLPAYPSSFEYSTLGGAVANNASGEKSIKYGDTKAFVKSLRVVLSNGEIIETGRLSKRELSKKLGLSTFEGEIYRNLDTLLEEKAGLLDQMDRPVSRNTAGYNLVDLRHGDGSLDLTPLFIGSQGTLGIISEITLETEVFNPETALLVATFDDISKASEAIRELRKNDDQTPSSIEFIDGGLLDLLDIVNPNQLKGLYEKPNPKAILIVEYDDPKEHQRKKNVKRAQKIFERLSTAFRVEYELAKQDEIKKLRDAVGTVLAYHEGDQKAVPVIDDGVVPLDKLEEYFTQVYALLGQMNIRPIIWGHAGDGNFHLQPYLNIGQLGDRQKAFRLMDSYYHLIISLGGTTSGGFGDGRLRGPYLKDLYGPEVYDLLQRVKQIFDPYGTLNPGVKLDVTLENVRPLLRTEYGISNMAPHLPRS